MVGCGDIGMRVLRLVRGRFRALALTRDAGRVAALRDAGATPVVADLDRPATLARIAALADWVLHLAPPPPAGRGDPRTANLVHALARSNRASRLVYVSTTGVYGDCGGDRIDETRALAPATGRAVRRVDAEGALFGFGARARVAVTVLRAPGIYAIGRPGGDPRDRLARATPALAAGDDVYTNHIHADDLARACVLALFRAPAPRVIHICDDSEMKMGDWFDAVADRFAMPRPPRIARAEAEAQLSPMQMSFMSESRRLDNARMKRELRLVLSHPSLAEIS